MVGGRCLPVNLLESSVGKKTYITGDALPYFILYLKAGSMFPLEAMTSVWVEEITSVLLET